MPYNAGHIESALVIGDTHEPYGHPDYPHFCKAVQEAYDLEHVLHVGDVVDFHASSYHESDPDLMSPGDELRAARKRLKIWSDYFPDMVISEGNHCTMPARKAKSAGLPADIVRRPNEYLETPETWVWVRDFVRFTIGPEIKCIMQHAWSGSPTAGLKEINNSCVLAGHNHSQMWVLWKTNDCDDRKFWLQPGTGIDKGHPAFAYGKKGAKDIIELGCGMIINGTPYTIPMYTDDRGRWIREVP